MQIKNILFFIFLISNTFLFSQNSILLQEDLYGKWVVKNDLRDPSRVYLIKLSSIRNYEGGGLNFLVGKYTGKLKIHLFNNKIPKRRIIKCGTGIKSPVHSYNMPHKFSETTWKYDTENKILHVEDPRFLEGRQFRVEKESINKIVLVKI